MVQLSGIEPFDCLKLRNVFNLIISMSDELSLLNLRVCVCVCTVCGCVWVCTCGDNFDRTSHLALSHSIHLVAMALNSSWSWHSIHLLGYIHHALHSIYFSDESRLPQSCLCLCLCLCLSFCLFLLFILITLALTTRKQKTNDQNQLLPTS